MLPGEIDFQSTKSESYLDPIPFSRSKMHFASSKVVTWWSLKACMLYSGPIFAFYVDQYPTTCGEGGQRVICISSFCPPLEIFRMITHWVAYIWVLRSESVIQDNRRRPSQCWLGGKSWDIPDMSSFMRLGSIIFLKGRCIWLCPSHWQPWQIMS